MHKQPKLCYTHNPFCCSFRMHTIVQCIIFPPSLIEIPVMLFLQSKPGLLTHPFRLRTNCPSPSFLPDTQTALRWRESGRHTHTATGEMRVSQPFAAAAFSGPVDCNDPRRSEKLDPTKKNARRPLKKSEFLKDNLVVNFRVMHCTVPLIAGPYLVCFVQMKLD